MAEIGKLWKFRHWNFISFIEQNKTFSALRADQAVIANI
jgi:hypothetical protein